MDTITEREQWIVLSTIREVELLKHRSVESLEKDLDDSDEDEMTMRDILKIDHILVTFLSQVNKQWDVISDIENKRIRYYDNDYDHMNKCICGCYDVLHYAYNIENGEVMGIGKTCVKRGITSTISDIKSLNINTSKFTKIDHKKCNVCGQKIKGFSIKTLGRCSICYTNELLPDYEDSLIYKYIQNILEKKKCKKCMLIGYKVLPLHHLCDLCFDNGCIIVKSGEYAGKTALEIAHKYENNTNDFSYLNDLSDYDKLLVSGSVELIKRWKIVGSEKVGFGKHGNLTREQCVKSKQDYISWCHNCARPSEDMRLLVWYAELFSKISSFGVDVE